MKIQSVQLLGKEISLNNKAIPLSISLLPNSFGDLKPHVQFLVDETKEEPKSYYFETLSDGDEGFEELDKWQYLGNFQVGNKIYHTFSN